MISKYSKGAIRSTHKQLIEIIEQRLLEIGITNKKIEPEPNNLNLKDKIIREKCLLLIDHDNIEQSYLSTVELIAAQIFNQITSLFYLEKTGRIPTNLCQLIYQSACGNKIHKEDLSSYNTLLSENEKKEISHWLLSQEYLSLLEFLFVKTYEYLESNLSFIFDYSVISCFLPDDLMDKRNWLNTLLIMLNNLDSNVQVSPYLLGELYQVFNNDRKNQIFKTLRSRHKISKETLSNTTLIFTPEWVVKYLVENSLGRFWIKELIRKNPVLTEAELVEKFGFKYYVFETEQDKDTTNKLKQKPALPLEQITFLDPACGTGNILVYAFEVFLKFYLNEGYSKEEASKLILSKNLYGLDINNENIKLAKVNLLVLSEFTQFQNFNIVNIANSDLEEKRSNEAVDQHKKISKKSESLNEILENASLLGSLLRTNEKELNLLEQYFNIDSLPVQKQNNDFMKALKLLNKQYHIVVANPPYFGMRFLGKTIDNYLKKHYELSHKDLYSAFIEQTLSLTQPQGYTGVIVQTSFLSIKTLSKLREKIIHSNSILSLIDLGRGIFGNDFGSTAFIIRKEGTADYTGHYYRLHEQILKHYALEHVEELFIKALENPDFTFDFEAYDANNFKGFYYTEGKKSRIHFLKNQQHFLKFPDSKIVYWADEKLEDHFISQPQLDHYANAKQGMATCDNERFLRLWFEIDFKDIKFNTKTKTEVLGKGYKWFPYNKGGRYRKWYGNNEYVINWENQGAELAKTVLKRYPYLSSPSFVIKNQKFYFRPSFSWSLVASKNASFRYKEPGFLFDIAGMSIFAEENLFYIGGLCNSVVSDKILEIINPTINYQCGDIARIPLIIDNKHKNYIEELVKENIELSKEDWDSFELSWDFKYHPFINGSSNLKEAFEKWDLLTEERFNKLKANEEELNKLFIEIYELPSLNSEVPDEAITVSRANAERETKSFLTYFLGCLFGRYSLDQEGLIFSGSGWSLDNYSSFKPLDLPLVLLSPSELFKTDVIKHLEHFLTVLFGEDTLEDNLSFLGDSIAPYSELPSREKLRNYFCNQFMEEYAKKTYKRPLYWIITSGKNKAFQALTFYHRFNHKVFQKISEYLPGLKTYYEEELKDQKARIKETKSRKDIGILKRKIKKLEACLDELDSFKKRIHELKDKDIGFDLDDGIKHNYLKLQTVSGINQNVFYDLHFEKQRKF